MTNKFISLSVALLVGFYGIAQNQEQLHHQLGIIIGFDIPNTQDVFGEVLQSHYKITELFDEFVTDPKANKVTLYEYNNTGKISIIRFYGSEDLYQQRKPDFQYIFDYGKGNRLIRYYNQGPPNINRIMTSLTYDSKGRIASLKRFGNKEGTDTYGKVLTTTIFAYDDAGNLSKSKETFNLGNRRPILTDYGYDANGSLISRLVYEEAPQGNLILVAKTTYGFRNGLKFSEAVFTSQPIDSLNIELTPEGLYKGGSESYEYSPNDKR